MLARHSLCRGRWGHIIGGAAATSLVKLSRIERVVSFIQLVELALEVLLIKAVSNGFLVDGAAPHARLWPLFTRLSRRVSACLRVIFALFSDLIFFIKVVDAVVEIGIVVLLVLAIDLSAPRRELNRAPRCQH